jgi:hypothetical protein
MNMGNALDVVIALVLMYLVLSLFCTTINEIIAGNILNLRSKNLKSAVQELIDDPTLKQLFDNHGLIDGAKVASTAGAQKPTQTGATSTGAYPSYLSGQTVALALIGILSDTGSTATPPPPTVIDQVKAGIATLKDTNIKDSLEACLAVAANDVKTLHDNLAAWFDNSMDRLSGAYKRRLQLISFLVGFAIACAFNADTLSVAKTLWLDPPMSAAVAQSATNIAKTDAPESNASTSPRAPAASAATPQPRGAAAASNTAQPPSNPGLSKNIANLKQLDAELRPLPLGWTNFPCGSDLFWKIVGLLITTIALSLGAPFWFDLLGQFVNIRAAGTKPTSTNPKAN